MQVEQLSVYEWSAGGAAQVRFAQGPHRGCKVSQVAHDNSGVMLSWTRQLSQVAYANMLPGSWPEVYVYVHTNRPENFKKKVALLSRKFPIRNPYTENLFGKFK